MQLHRFYYILKPFLPRKVRMGIRRMFARRKRGAFENVWPINEATGQTPAGWPGWPDGKKFAVVLTHDVEGPDGVAKSRELAELEMEFGFRSSFNFIPEGPYRVTKELRSWLGTNGFEVGVHDLNHDGHLYSSQQGFAKKAVRINQYLREWGAVGFRAGFMLRNLDWVHHLNIQYDASTFDTDPFEPQPDAAGTIFPFWIKAPPKPVGDPEQGKAGNLDASGQSSALSSTAAVATPDHASASTPAGYVELPYTLPQDSTLFLLLQERTNEIWRKKLDWVVSRGGMVLVNVHPDYLDMKGDGPEFKQVVRDHYRDLLRYINDTYGQNFWHVLPREMAAYVHRVKDQNPLTPGTPQ